MADAGLKIVIGADISAVIDGMKVASNSVAQFGNRTAKAFDEVAASSAALSRIEAAINEAAASATGAGARFDTMGGRLPLADFNTFRSSVNRLKSDISSGLLLHVSRIPGALNPITPAADNAANALNRIRPGASQAGAALTNVGRIAQDLPFGFIGIQNNLNPLLESFQRLKAETGSSKAAFQALGSSLIGAGGIGLALSVVSSAFLIFQNGIAGFNRKSKEAKDAADDLAKSIRSINTVEGEGAASIQGQIANVNALALVIEDSNKPYIERKRALEELKSINKNYLGDLTLEDAATSKLKDTVNDYVKALINSGIQKSFQDEIVKVARAVVDSDDEIKKSREKLGRATREAERLEKLLQETRQGPQVQTGLGDTRVLHALKAQKKAEDELAAANEKTTKLLVQQALLTDKLNRAKAEAAKFKPLENPSGSKKEEDSLTKQLNLLEKIRDAAKEFQGNMFGLNDIDDATDALANLEQQVGDLKLQIAVRDAKKAKLPAAEVEKLKDAIKLDTQKRLNEAFEKEALLLEFSTKLKFSQVNRAEIPGNIDSVIAKATGFDKKIPEITIPQVRLKFQSAGLKFRIPAEILNALDELNIKLKDQIKSIFEGGLSDVFAGLGEGLGESFGEALTGGSFGDGLKRAAQNILGIVGTVMQQLGKALITAAIKIKLLKETFEKWAIANPALAIVAGIGLVAAGAALKNIKFDGPKFADGGIVSGPMIGQVGERFRPEVILPLDRLPQLFKQFGGDFGGGMQLIPIINNEGLYLAMKRGERSAGRKF